MCIFCRGSWPKEYEPQVLLDGRRISDVRLEDWENTSALERFADLDLMKGKKVTLFVRLPQDLNKCKRLKIYALRGNGENSLVFPLRCGTLSERQGKPFYYIEEEKSQSIVENAEGQRLGCIPDAGYDQCL